MHERERASEKEKKLREELEAKQKRVLRETLGEESAEIFDELDVDPELGREHAAPLFLVRHNIRRYEDYVRHMYRDTSSEGVVTVGLGFALPRESDVDSFTWYERTSRKKIPHDIARKEWRAVKALLKGQSMDYYLRRTALELSDSEISSVLNRKLFKLQQDLRREFRIAGIEFDHLPLPVQEAMYDMGWNMGAAFINKIDPEKARRMRWKTAPMWPKLTTALFLQDWEGVAVQSERGGVGERRNNDIKTLIRAALKQAGKSFPELPESQSWE